MADTNETIADIIAEMRKTKYGDAECEVKWCLTQWADRIEVALRRERGDAAKLREALKAIVGLCAGLMPTWDGAIGRIKDIAEAALAAPPRNCDVGTAKEQDERFHRFCVKHHTGSCAGCHNPVGDYTVANGVRECALVWAQMPYEEGGAK